MRRAILAAGWCLAVCSSAGAAGPNVLNETQHAASFIATGVNAVSSGLVDTSIFIDYNPWIQAGYLTAPTDVTNTSPSPAYLSVASGTAVNHAPYALSNCSCAGYAPQLEQNAYATFLAAQSSLVIPLALPISGPLPSGSPAPVLYLVSSSVNSSDGGSGWGIELGFSAGYKGLNTTADSWVSAELAGFAAVLLFNHPSYNIWDVKAALRVTASNWASGYDHTSFGYGLINWDAANASPALYLQPPVVTTSTNSAGYYATFVIYPFRQTRRSHEVLYSVNPSYVWPVKNEYSLSDITASGGTLLYTGNSTDTTPTYVYAPATSGTVTVIAFTTDGAGAYSRVEEFSKLTVNLIVGTVCSP